MNASCGRLAIALTLVALVIPIVDSFSVWRGPTRHILDERPDLANRKGKAPGGYQYTLEEARLPPALQHRQLLVGAVLVGGQREDRILDVLVKPDLDHDRDVLALRVGGKKLWGTYPYHEAAFIGGPDTVRGLRRRRPISAASAADTDGTPLTGCGGCGG